MRSAGMRQINGLLESRCVFEYWDYVSLVFFCPRSLQYSVCSVEHFPFQCSSYNTLISQNFKPINFKSSTVGFGSTCFTKWGMVSQSALVSVAGWPLLHMGIDGPGVTMIISPVSWYILDNQYYLVYLL